MEHVRTGTRLYSDKPYTYTRCQEKTDSWQLCVGGFGAAGLRVHYDYYDGDASALGVSGSSFRRLVLGPLGDLGIFFFSSSLIGLFLLGS